MSTLSDFNYPKCLDLLSDIFFDEGYLLHIVGGYIRDYLQGYNSCDIDICSSAPPQKVKDIIKNMNGFKITDCNLPMGTIIIKCGSQTLEYTTFRRESYRGDGFHTPNTISLDATLEQDTKRRDFTCNAIYYDIKNKEIIDLFGGIEDIKNKVLQTTRHPHDVFKEDALRILRMCRISAQNMFYPTYDVVKAARELSPNIVNLSRERVVTEIDMLFCSDTKYNNNNYKNLLHGLNLLYDSGVLSVIAPNIKKANFKVASVAKSISVRIALLFDGSFASEETLSYICINNAIKNQVRFILSNYKFDDKYALDFILNNDYDKCVLLNEYLAIKKIQNKNLDNYLRNMNQTGKPLSQDTLEISGQEIMDILKIKSSPEVGQIKRELLAYTIKLPNKNNKNDLIRYLRDHYML